MDPTNDTKTEAVAELRASLFSDLLSYDEACEALGGMSRYTLSRLVKDEKLESVAIGNRRYIPHASLAAYIRELREQRPRARSAVA